MRDFSKKEKRKAGPFFSLTPAFSYTQKKKLKNYKKMASHSCLSLSLSFLSLSLSMNLVSLDHGSELHTHPSISLFESVGFLYCVRSAEALFSREKRKGENRIFEGGIGRREAGGGRRGWMRLAWLTASGHVGDRRWRRRSAVALRLFKEVNNLIVKLPLMLSSCYYVLQNRN